MEDITYHDHDTISKVYDSLKDLVPAQDSRINVVTAIQNAGILFRERGRPSSQLKTNGNGQLVLSPEQQLRFMAMELAVKSPPGPLSMQEKSEMYINYLLNGRTHDR